MCRIRDPTIHENQLCVSLFHGYYLYFVCTCTIPTRTRTTLRDHSHHVPMQHHVRTCTMWQDKQYQRNSQYHCTGYVATTIAAMTTTMMMMNRRTCPLLLVLVVVESFLAHGFSPVVSSVHHLPSVVRTPFQTSPSVIHSSSTQLQVVSSAAASVVLDMGREAYKLQSMATYSTITALVMNACLRLYTSQRFARHPTTKNARWCENLFTLSTTLCIIGGVFTAVLFNILGIYAKECLGLGNTAGYLSFQAATAIYRKWGFRTFLMTALSFICSFLLSVYEKTQEGDADIGRWVIVGSIVLTLFAGFHIQAVLSLATQFIYTPDFKALHKIA